MCLNFLEVKASVHFFLKQVRVYHSICSYSISTGEGNGKPLQYSCLENPMNSMKRQNDRILKEKLPRSVGAQYSPGDQ